MKVLDSVEVGVFSIVGEVQFSALVLRVHLQIAISVLKNLYFHLGFSYLGNILKDCLKI